MPTNNSFPRRYRKVGTRRATFLLVVAATCCCSTTKLVVDATCPAIGDALRLVIIGNSYTGGTSVGRACDDDAPGEPACHNMAVPGNVANFDVATYPGIYNRAPDTNTLVDPSRPYHPSTNPHRGDVPGKMKLIAEHICSAYLGGGGPGGAEPAIARHRSYIRRFDDHSGRDNIFVDGNDKNDSDERSLETTTKSNTFQYIQNSQSRFTTRSHSGQLSSVPHEATLRILDSYDDSGQTYDVVIIQPMSTELLEGTSDKRRMDALTELLRTDRAAATPNTRYIVQQTWPRRESTGYNQMCKTLEGEDKLGYMEAVDTTLRDMKEVIPTEFIVAPTGTAFVEFAKLACGPAILPEGACAFDSNVVCPIWYGEAGKASLYHENIDEEGSHQSEEVGAWLSAAVLYGTVQSSNPCYVESSDLKKVMPTPSNLADIPSGIALYDLVAQAAQAALKKQFGSSIGKCASFNPPMLDPKEMAPWRLKERRRVRVNRAKFNKRIGDTYTFQLEMDGVNSGGNSAAIQSMAVTGGIVSSGAGGSNNNGSGLTIHQVFKRISEATRDVTVVGLDVLYGNRGVPRRVRISRSGKQDEYIQIKRVKSSIDPN